MHFNKVRDNVDFQEAKQSNTMKISVFNKISIFSLGLFTAALVGLSGVTLTAQVSAQAPESPGVSRAVEATKNKAEKEVLKTRKNRVARDKQTRQALCDNRRGAILNKVDAYSKTTESTYARLFETETKLRDLVTTAGLNENGDIKTALADVDKARDGSDVAVKTLDTVVGSGEINCEQFTDNAVWLVGVKEATIKSRETLKDYRDSLKKVVAALSERVSSDASSTEAAE